MRAAKRCMGAVKGHAGAPGCTKAGKRRAKAVGRCVGGGLALWFLCLLAAGCGKNTVAAEGGGGEPVKEKIVVGFSQLGAESDWRSANTESMKTTFTAENGYELIVEDGQQKQANQIMAIRTFIQREVDYIVLAPVIETGWDTVFQEAKDAGIPVIIVDRMVDVEDEELYAAWAGSDFVLEGAKAGEWLSQFLSRKGIERANIVNIQGTIGSSAQIGRTRGLQRACDAHENMSLLAEMPGDFTQAKGREVMEVLLRRYNSNINVAWCENDNEAFGVIEAIEASGREVGSDIAGGQIMVVSFDGVKKETLEYVVEDKISYIGECNPHQGPMVREIIELLEAGEKPDKFSYLEEEMYVHDSTVESVVVGRTKYPVSVITSP